MIHNSRFNFYGKKRIILYLSIQIFGLILAAPFHYFFKRAIDEQKVGIQLEYTSSPLCV